MSFMQRIAGLAVIGLLVAAGLGGPAFAAARDLPRINLKVAELQVIPAYAPPRKAPNVEHRIEIPPATLAAAWARERVRAVGTANRARVVVLEGSVVEVRLKGGGLFRKSPDRRYDAKLTLAAEIRTDAGDLLGRVTATATRSQEVMPNPGEEALAAIWKKLTEQLVADAAKELQKQIKARLGPYAR